MWLFLANFPSQISDGQSVVGFRNPPKSLTPSFFRPFLSWSNFIFGTLSHFDNVHFHWQLVDAEAPECTVQYFYTDSGKTIFDFYFLLVVSICSKQQMYFEVCANISNRHMNTFLSQINSKCAKMYCKLCAKTSNTSLSQIKSKCTMGYVQIVQILQTYIWATCKYFKHLNTFLCQINRWAHPMKVCALVNVHKIVFRWYIRLTFCIFLVFVFCNQYIFDFVCTSIVFRWYIHPGAIAKTTGAWCKG